MAKGTGWHNSDRIKLETVPGKDTSYRVVYCDGLEVRRFDTRSDDYAYSNAMEYADKLHRKHLEEAP